MTWSSLPRLWGQGIERDGEDDCWVGEDTPDIMQKNTGIAKELNLTTVLDQIQEYRPKWLKHINKMPLNL